MDLYQAQKVIQELGNKAESLDILRLSVNDTPLKSDLIYMIDLLEAHANRFRGLIDMGEFD